MHPRRLAHRPANGADAEFEALQTDVMRFVAILGLCLMAIFALVQSFGTHSKEPPPKTAERPQPVRGVQTGPRAVEMPYGRSPTRQAEVAEARPDLDTTRTPTKDRRTTTEPLEQERLALGVQLARERRTLRNLEEKVSQRRRHLAQLREEVAQERRTLAREVRRVPEPADVPGTPAADLSVEDVPTTGPEPRGFVLRFASDDAMGALVARGEVGVYALAAKQAWHLHTGDGRLSFEAAKAPGVYHEMTPSTVPESFRLALGGLVPLSQVPRLVWAVTLPESMAHDLRRLMSGAEAGELIIHANGAVRLSGHPHHYTPRQ